MRRHSKPIFRNLKDSPPPHHIFHRRNRTAWRFFRHLSNVNGEPFNKRKSEDVFFQNHGISQDHGTMGYAEPCLIQNHRTARMSTRSLSPCLARGRRGIHTGRASRLPRQGLRGAPRALLAGHLDGNPKRPKTSDKKPGNLPNIPRKTKEL